MGDVAGDPVADALGLDVRQLGNELFVVFEVVTERLRVPFHEQCPGLLDVGGFDSHCCSPLPLWHLKKVRKLWKNNR